MIADGKGAENSNANEIEAGSPAKGRVRTL